jgi:EAL domain-containing protein (putative c-di-GMP-specific phosphodiesterase class I)/ActR/RegA family two-component response regulator
MTHRKNRLLVVDDEAEIRSFVRDVAEEMGVDVDEAATFEAFFDIYDPGRHGMIMLDLSMPGRDGIELLRDLSRKDCKAPIHLSSGQDPRVLATANRLGRDFGLDMGEILAKPVCVPDLERCLRAVFGETTAITPEILSRALENGEFVPYYQPQVNLRDGQTYNVVAAEALARWHHPRLGLVSPGVFIPMMEEAGLIGRLTEVMLDRVVDHLAEWRDDGRALPVSINVAPAALTDLDFPDKISSILERAALDPSLLVVEITESTAMADSRKSIDILTRLRLKNINVSLDDFGAGFSSLVELYRMPLSELKLDRSLIVDIDQDEGALTVVRGILALARELRIPVCAEGVETKKSAETLRGLGCPKDQGFLFSHPLPAREFSAFINNRAGQELVREIG